MVKIQHHCMLGHQGSMDEEKKVQYDMKFINTVF